MRPSPADSAGRRLPIEAGKGDPSRASRPADTASRPERVCPNCGSALLELKCKLLCPRRDCGYYMSCSDFY
jgi:hypothetical protein